MITVIIPCLNEEAVLPQIYTRVTAAASAWGEPYEIILIDDGSTDGTWERIKSFHRRDQRWKGVRLARNFGHQAALGVGLHAARGRAVVILDADLQDPPELIQEFVQQWRDGFPIVYGVRNERPEGWHKRICYAGFYWLLTKTAAVPMPGDAGDFCLLDRKVVEVLKSLKEAHPYWRGLRAWTGFRQIGIPYTRHSRQGGEPQYSLRKLLKLASDGFWSVSHAPMLMIKGLSWISLLVLIILAWTISKDAATVASSSMLLALMLLGVGQILGFSLLGRLVNRIHDQVRQRPRWLIASTIGMKKRHREQHKQDTGLDLEKTHVTGLPIIP